MSSPFTTRHLVWRGILSLAIVVGLLALALRLDHLSPAHAAGEGVAVWLTTADLSNHLTPQAGLTFGPASTTGTTITVDEAQQFQQMTGFGAAMTDSSAWLINTKQSAAQRNALMQQLFTTAGDGIGINFLRVPMGASDFITADSSYSYDDQPAGQTDPSLANFSIGPDTANIIPLLQQARQINPQAVLMANPWSPPGWMKDSGTMLGGQLLASSYDPLARYFVKFIQAYQAQNIPINFVTPQNEPTLGTTPPTGYAAMGLTASDEANFIANNLAPALANAGLSTKILAGDTIDWQTAYPETILGNGAANAAIAGTAYHCYAGDASAMTQVHNAYPNKDIYDTECSTGVTGPAPVNAITDVIAGTQNWAKSALLWNIALDPNDGPRIAGGCNNCTGLVAVDPNTGNVTYLDNYYQLGQVSKFVASGAYHIAATSFNGTIADVAFKNPDGTKVVVAYNPSGSSQAFNVAWNNESFAYTLPAGAVATFTWAGTATTNLVRDAGYEGQTSGSLSSPWGADLHAGNDCAAGVDINNNAAHSGQNNGWLYCNGNQQSSVWAAHDQNVAVQPNTTYTLSVWVNNNTGSLGAAADLVVASVPWDNVRQTQFTPTQGSYGQATLTFTTLSGESQITIEVGYNAPAGQATGLRIDDWSLTAN